jgi:hypothetical protein
MLDVSVRALAARNWYRAVATVRLSSMLIAQLSDLHVGGARHEASLLRAVIE